MFGRGRADRKRTVVARGRWLTGVVVVCGASVVIAPTASAGPRPVPPPVAAPAAAPGQVAWGTSATARFGVAAQLFGVTATSGQAWAVGAANPTGAPPTQVLTDPYAERFDGTRWVATPVPRVTTYGASRSVALRGAAAVASNDVWAVGSVDDLSSPASRTLAYHWDGAAWTRVPTPNPGAATAGNHLTAVAAQSGHTVYAVGDTGSAARSLVLRYDGSTWTSVSTPNYGRLVGVAADATGIWVAGTTIVARFDGRTWTALPAVPAGRGALRLAGLAGDDHLLWVVGDDRLPVGEGYLDTPYAARFSGGRWTRLPGSGATSPYTGVATDGTTAWATSFQDTVTRFDGSTAALEVTPAPGRLLTAVAADTTGRQWAVGGTTGAPGVQPAIITAPGIGQGGLAVTSGASGAAVTWLGPGTGSGLTDSAGRFTVGGLPVGAYTVVVSLPHCTPAVATVTVGVGVTSPVEARIACP